MSDTGTTAVQVSPSSEEDMSKVREMFDRALNAIVQATTLAKQVEDLAFKVEQLSRDVDKERQRNAWLDEQLTSVRATRDQALGELSQAKAEVATVKAENEGLTSRATQAEATIAELKAEVEALRKERDDHGLRAMELEDHLSKANSTIAKVQALFPQPVAATPIPAPAPEVVPFRLPSEPAPAQDYQEAVPVETQPAYKNW